MKFKSILYASVFCLAIFNCKTKTAKKSTKIKNSTSVSVIKNYSYSTDSLLKHVKILSSDAFEGRKTGTEGAFKAKTYIVEALSKQGVTPLGAHYEQHFKFDDYDAVNILGVVKGTEKPNEYIVLSAHYDHEGIKNGKIYNGADDDASGISALIAFAEYFKKNPPKYSVIIAAFDAEELGLKGAYHFVANSIIPKENIKLNMNMDMISRSDENELYAVGSRFYPKLKPTIKEFEDIGKVDLLIGHEGLDSGDNWAYSSDHAAFHKAKIPFIYFGVADHEDYHKPTDDFERIHNQFYQDAVETIIQVFKQFDTQEL